MDRIAEKEVKFNAIEEICYQIGCEVGREILKNILENLDDALAKDRDKRVYRHKGKRKTTLKTLMGEVEYQRALYKVSTQPGETMHVYLLDELLQVETIGQLSTNLILKLAEQITTDSYRNTARTVSRTTGQGISHGGVWNAIQKLGERLSEKEEEQVREAKAHEGKGSRQVPVLFEEADGIWINMQGKDRPKKARKREVKVACFYEGWKRSGKNKKTGEWTYTLYGKQVIGGLCPAEKFFEKKEGLIAANYDVDEIKMRIVNGDGNGWVKGFGKTDDPDTYFQLDPFHQHQAVMRGIKNKQVAKEVRAKLARGDILQALAQIRGYAENAEDESEKKSALTLYGYLESNKDDLIPCIDRGLEIPTPPEGLEYRTLGTMEHQVCDTIALRMKHRKASFSVNGAENLVRLLCLSQSKKLETAITTLSVMLLPEKYVEELNIGLTAAQVKAKIGKGYAYPSQGGMPFAQAVLSNGRKAIRRMLSDRQATDLMYR